MNHKLPRFLAVDGEGKDDRFGKHHYTLLACSTGDYIEAAVWDKGLSTQVCLDFLLTCKAPNTVMVGFSFDYDVNMILRDLKPQQLRRLWRRGDCIWRGEMGDYYHLKYAPRKFFAIQRITPGTLTNRRLKTGRRHWQYFVKHRGASTQVWDVFGFFQKSFVKTLEEWLPQNSTAIATIARMKEKRGQFQHEQDESIRLYCLQECTLLVQVMDELAKALWGVGIELTSWHGAGAIAHYLLRQHHINDKLNWRNLWPGVRNASLWAYFGGRVEIFQQGVIEPPVYDYDLNSAYPAACVHLPNMYTGRWDKYAEGEYHENALYALWQVEWDIPSSHPLAWLAPFPMHVRDGGVYWCRNGYGWYHALEVAAAKQLFGEYIRVYAGYEYLPYTQERPFRWVYDVYKERQQYKQHNDPRHYPLKLGMNSLYGKMAQGEARSATHLPPFQNYYAAGFITAYTRAKLLLQLAATGKENALSAATDAVFTRAPLDVVTSPNLGSWSVTEIQEPLLLLQAGVFYTPSQKLIRSRGFGSKTLDYATLEPVWNASRERGNYSYIERRFVGFGSCVARNTPQAWQDWRNWCEQTRSLNFSYGNKKLPDFSLLREHRDGVSIGLQPGMPSHLAGDMSLPVARPYRPKSWRHEEGEQNYQDYISDLEQPDLP